MKQKIAKFLLFLHTEHVQEDWTLYSKLGRTFVYPAWFLKAVVTHVFFFLYIPEYLFNQSKQYKAFMAMTSNHSIEASNQMTRDFLHSKSKKTRNFKFKI